MSVLLVVERSPGGAVQSSVPSPGAGPEPGMEEDAARARRVLAVVLAGTAILAALTVATWYGASQWALWPAVVIAGFVAISSVTVWLLAPRRGARRGGITTPRVPPRTVPCPTPVRAGRRAHTTGRRSERGQRQRRSPA